MQKVAIPDDNVIGRQMACIKTALAVLVATQWPMPHLHEITDRSFVADSPLEWKNRTDFSELIRRLGAPSWYYVTLLILGIERPQANTHDLLVKHGYWFMR